MENIQPASGQLRRRLTSALLAFSLVAVTMAMTATRSEAASLVLACFEPSDYSDRTGGTAVWLQAYEGGRWTTIGYGSLSDGGYPGTAGCYAWNIAPAYQNRYLRAKINDDITYYGVWKWGESNSYAYPGFGGVVLWGWVHSTGGAWVR